MSRWRRFARPVRFLAVGAVNTAFGYLAYAALLWLGLHYAAAVVVGTVLGVMFNFMTTGTLVFDGLSAGRFARFVGAYAVTCGVNILCLRLLTGLGLDPYRAGALCLLPMAAFSYGLMRWFVFQEGGHGPR